ncbi:DUF4158 domain-containing protein [Streptomyces lydicus]|uniref:DUF4158 domain-containing protein n=1 Tax=Streptomyces lydicus TaxID=47763 RepID=UPI00343CB1B7
MRQEWSPEELLASWTLVDGDWDLVANKSGSTRLGFSLMLKFFESEGRFPDLLEEVPQAAVEYVAGLVKVPTADFTKYDLTSRSAKNHRKQIREALKFRPATRADEEELIAWLADEVRPVELVEDRLREALLVECRERTIEPPGRIDRIVTAAQIRAEKAFCARTIERLGGAGVARLLALVTEDSEAGAALLAALKRDPGAVGLDSLLTETIKLNDVWKLGLSDGLFADCSEKLLAAWRARAIKMYPSGLPGYRRGCTDHATCGAVLVPAGGDHRCPGGSAGRPGAEDQRSCRAAGGEAVDGGAEEGAGQGGHPLQACRRGDRQAGRDRAYGSVPGGRGEDAA